MEKPVCAMLATLRPATLPDGICAPSLLLLKSRSCGLRNRSGFLTGAASFFVTRYGGIAPSVPESTCRALTQTAHLRLHPTTRRARCNPRTRSPYPSPVSQTLRMAISTLIPSNSDVYNALDEALHFPTAGQLMVALPAASSPHPVLFREGPGGPPLLSAYRTHS